VRKRASRAVTAGFILGALLCGCADPIPGRREEVIDGRFARWPAELDEGDAWRVDGAAELDVSRGDLSIRSTGADPAGAVTLLPVAPGREVLLTLEHAGGPGRIEVTLDDLGSTTVLDLPGSATAREVSTSLAPQRDGIRLRFLDLPGDDASLRIDRVSVAAHDLGTVYREPPIRILVVTHAETDVLSSERYWERRETIAATADLLEDHDLRLTLLLSGPFAEWALHEGDSAFFTELQQRGHEIGTYVFPLYRVGELFWEVGDIFEPGMADLEWADHRGWVDQLVAPHTNRTVCAYAPMADMATLMADHGFDLDLSSVAVSEPEGASRESVAWDYIGHHPHHPYRPADPAIVGQELAGDPDGSYVTIGHAAQVGRSSAHGAPCGVEDYQRILGQLHDRWTGHQRAPAAADRDRVWVFGVLHNAKQGEAYGDEFADLVDHLASEYLGQATDEGNLVATGATASEVLAEYLGWESEHPDDPGFSFTLPP
jgi:hypothetical protein